LGEIGVPALRARHDVVGVQAAVRIDRRAVAAGGAAEAVALEHLKRSPSGIVQPDPRARADDDPSALSNASARGSTRAPRLAVAPCGAEASCAAPSNSSSEGSVVCPPGPRRFSS
jgi:hypothetical protein